MKKCPTSETELHCDASRDGYGAVLLQKDPEDRLFHPVMFMSKKTNQHERNYSSFELEVLAVIEAIKKFRVYLMGLDFKIVSDCSAFRMTMEKKDVIPRIARWALFLQEYSYKIEHRPGLKMAHCDALSRNPVALIVQNAFLLRLHDLQKNDRELNTVISLLKHGPYKNYILEHDLLYAMENEEKLLVIPKSMQRELIAKAHENGHFAARKTEELLRREYTFPNLKTKVEDFVRSCVHCILAERKKGKGEGFLSYRQR